MGAISFALTAHGSVPAELACSGCVCLGPWDEGQKPGLSIIHWDNRRFDMLHCYTFSAVFGYLLSLPRWLLETHYNKLSVTVIWWWKIFCNSVPNNCSVCSFSHFINTYALCLFIVSGTTFRHCCDCLDSLDTGRDYCFTSYCKAAISLHRLDLILILHASIFRPGTYLGY